MKDAMTGRASEPPVTFPAKDADHTRNAAIHRMEGNANAPVLYMAVEPSNTTWKAVFGDMARRRHGAASAGELMKLHEAVVKGRFPGQFAAQAHR